MSNPLVLSAFTASSALGVGVEPLLMALREGTSGLKPCDFESAVVNTWIGEVPGVDTAVLPPDLAEYDCRNNRLALLGLGADGFEQSVRAAMSRYGADRLALILGTSTSGILSAELAYRERNASGALPDGFNYRTTHNTASVAAFVRAHLGLRGPVSVVSTACSSSAKAFAAADRLISAGLADAAVVGGVDSLCLTTLYGFSSLELTSPEPCRPGDAARQGLSIGEAAAFALLEPASGAPGEIVLSGWGESSDAHHMSAPHPEGRGSRAAMQEALDRAGLSAGDIGYINLHGTATPANDASEGAAVAAIFGNGVPCSSTKGMTGHTLGAAGGLEAVISALALKHGLLPASVGTQTPDPSIPIDLVSNPRPAPSLRHVLSNSFGFGGSNCSLILSLAPPGEPS
ncbi:beta-ketoacyl-[acyl-carrier-protein] synthase family protein [Ottowia thiooxydans]|uniref:beta-ketoacyl-[acyl-carrier-protein] synthase family protein n=1 Tax=Ottowia thiooxydans TaxID=219182 RepID=UPI000411265F|nr:beta-ketoacyl-[acyl-carrier-protein] synthase family protein [Ottowia thiooxydans]